MATSRLLQALLGCLTSPPCHPDLDDSSEQAQQIAKALLCRLPKDDPLRSLINDWNAACDNEMTAVEAEEAEWAEWAAEKAAVNAMNACWAAEKAENEAKTAEEAEEAEEIAAKAVAMSSKASKLKLEGAKKALNAYRATEDAEKALREALLARIAEGKRV